MAKNKIGLQLTGFDELIEQFEKLDGDVKGITEACLRVGHDTVTSKLKKDMQKHVRTGKTRDSIQTSNKVTWVGNTASIDVGFNLKKGGMPSIFLMYGTPKMRKDQKLYDDIYGTRVRKEIAEKQKEILENAIAKRMGG